MKKNIIISLLLFVSMVFINAEVKIDKIGVINLEEVFSTVFSGSSSVIQDIKKDKEEMKNKLALIKDNIVKLENQKLKEKNASTQIAYDKKIAELKKEYSDYYKIKNYEIKKKMENIQGSLIDEIKNTVMRIAESEGYTIVFDINSDDIFYYSIDCDITQKVIDFFNKKYGEEKVQ